MKTDLQDNLDCSYHNVALNATFCQTMEHQNILDLVQQSTKNLVAEKLQSTSIVIARLRDLIEEANRLGHSHSAIHARLQAGGLATGWNTYRACLVRARKSAVRAAGAPATP